MSAPRWRPCGRMWVGMEEEQEEEEEKEEEEEVVMVVVDGTGEVQGLVTPACVRVCVRECTAAVHSLEHSLAVRAGRWR